MVGLPVLNFDPFDPGCGLLPPGVDGIWFYDGISGIIMRAPIPPILE